MASDNINISSRDRTLAQELASAFDWWKEAGVDCDFTDEPVDRFAEALAEAEALEAASKRPEQKAPAPQPKPAPRAFAPRVKEEASGQLRESRENWPQTIDRFQEWWVSDASLAIIGGGNRVPPRGVAEADLMVIVSQPEVTDRETLLSGQHGKLVAGFLRAAGIENENTYFATSLPSHAELPDWRALNAAGLGEVLAHHIALAKPKRILALGRNILPLLGHDQAQGTAQVTPPQGKGAAVPILAVAGPDELLRSAPRRKRLWHHWLEWSA